MIVFFSPYEAPQKLGKDSYFSAFLYMIWYNISKKFPKHSESSIFEDFGSPYSKYIEN